MFKISHDQYLLKRDTDGETNKHQVVTSLERASHLAWSRASKIGVPTPYPNGYRVVGKDGKRHTWSFRKL